MSIVSTSTSDLTAHCTGSSVGNGVVLEWISVRTSRQAEMGGSRLGQPMVSGYATNQGELPHLKLPISLDSLAPRKGSVEPDPRCISRYVIDTVIQGPIPSLSRKGAHGVEKEAQCTGQIGAKPETCESRYPTVSRPVRLVSGRDLERQLCQDQACRCRDLHDQESSKLVHPPTTLGCSWLFTG